MKILQVNNIDLPGKIFNGHDLQLSLNSQGIEAYQMVMEKVGDEKTTIPICSKHELVIRNQMNSLENRLGMTNLLEPFVDKIISSTYFQNADLVHYHLIHNNILSILDLKKIFSMKPAVWTVHDPWLVGGHCIYPLECDKWKSGCYECENLSRPFAVSIDKTESNWKIKRSEMCNLDCDIVVSTDWMKTWIEKSPITSGLKNIHKIPFGLKLEEYGKVDKLEAKNKFNINPQHVVIAFRAEEHVVKGLKYIVEALEKLQNENVTILTVGTATLPQKIKEKMHVIELGWQDEKGVMNCLAAADIFLMPSLAESFGLMAIEAMASKCCVIVFKDTVLEQVTFAPECGLAVSLRNSKALLKVISMMIKDEKERKFRGDLGQKMVEEHYLYNNYVKKHVELYQEVLLKKTHSFGTYYWRKYMNESEKALKNASIKKLQYLKEYLHSISKGKAQKICIFCVGNYGTSMYYELKERLIKIDYVVDNNSNKWGTWLEGIRCVGIEELEKDRDNVIVIVCNKNNGPILEELKNKKFPYVLTKNDIDEIIFAIPKCSDLIGIEEILNLDYSSDGVKMLVSQFNKTVYEICSYYENKLNESE